jgi:hypothetical protein
MAQDLSKRGKVGDVYRGGSYKKSKVKTAGLSSDEMKRATTLKGKKVSAGQMKKAGVLKDISSTRWEKGKGVVGPGGKAFTGSVQLASGKTASYVKGRRIGVGPEKPKPKATTQARKPRATSMPAAKPKTATGTKRQTVTTTKAQDRAAVSRGGTKPSTRRNIRGGTSRPDSRPQVTAKPRPQYTVSGKKRTDPVPVGDIFRRLFSGYGGR